MLDEKKYKCQACLNNYKQCKMATNRYCKQCVDRYTEEELEESRIRNNKRKKAKQKKTCKRCLGRFTKQQMPDGWFCLGCLEKYTKEELQGTNRPESKDWSVGSVGSDW